MTNPQTPVHIGNVIRNAVVFDFKNWPAGPMNADSLPLLYRQGSFAQVGIYENDIATLIHDYSVDMKAILKELSHHLSESDMEEVRRSVGEIQQRIERFRKGSDQSSA